VNICTKCKRERVYEFSTILLSTVVSMSERSISNVVRFACIGIRPNCSERPPDSLPTRNECARNTDCRWVYIRSVMRAASSGVSRMPKSIAFATAVSRSFSCSAIARALTSSSLAASATASSAAIRSRSSLANLSSSGSTDMDDRRKLGRLLPVLPGDAGSELCFKLLRRRGFAGSDETSLLRSVADPPRELIPPLVVTA